MTKENKQRIEADYLRYTLNKYPSFIGRENCLPSVKFSDSDTKKLENCILDFLKFNGHHAVRQHTTGTRIDKRKIVSDCIGRVRQIGSVQWVAGQNEVGRADILAKIMVNFKGRLIPVSVEIEVKFGKDFQSEKQKEFEQNLKDIGAYYTITKDFDSFLIWYDDFIKSFT